MSLPGATPPPGAESPDPTVLELLRGSALAPMLDRPVGDILQDMGLPPLPDLQGVPPLPGMPPLPVIDLSALMRPLTDLAAAFGTGRFAPAPEPVATQGEPNGEGGAPPSAQPVAAPPPPGADPTQVLSNVSSTLQTVMSLGTSALQLVMTLWQGQAAQQAAGKAAAASADSAALGAQSTGQKSVMLGAAGSVAVGSAQLAGVVAKQAAVMAMAPLFIVSGVGQVFLVQQTIQSITEALGITAKTKGELAVHSGTMTKVGTKIPITGAPTGVKSSQDVSQLLSLLSPLMSMGTQAGQAIGQLAKANTALSAPTSVARPEDATAASGGGAGGAGGAGGGAGIGGFAGGGAGVGGAAVGATSQPLNPWQGTRVAGGVSGAAASGVSSGLSGGMSQLSGSGGSGGYLPMGGAAGAAGAGRAGEASTDEALRGNLVTGRHGDEVVGHIEGVSLPVVGATDTTPEPPPDKELTL
ncbi:hypothetical protein [Nocardia blacklockiae]|uniref:hypothetical protein n=1 Tax=Nocardia blacklockiae TaxID=480036 RepID=UPI001896230D|nr:hypothetical protein [Nocardia blacklockiae]MBF6171401.1 hypothetical protein [Nocardia blacklockiae]